MFTCPGCVQRSIRDMRRRCCIRFAVLDIWFVTGLGKIFRTTAFKLSLAYLTIFAIGAGLVLARVAWNMKTLFDEQVAQTVAAEITGLTEQYNGGGIRRL